MNKHMKTVGFAASFLVAATVFCPSTYAADKGVEKGVEKDAPALEQPSQAPSADSSDTSSASPKKSAKTSSPKMGEKGWVTPVRRVNDIFGVPYYYSAKIGEGNLKDSSRIKTRLAMGKLKEELRNMRRQKQLAALEFLNKLKATALKGSEIGAAPEEKESAQVEKKNEEREAKIEALHAKVKRLRQNRAAENRAPYTRGLISIAGEDYAYIVIKGTEMKAAVGDVLPYGYLVKSISPAGVVLERGEDRIVAKMAGH